MVNLINEIQNLVKKPLKNRRPTWVEVLGEEKIDALDELISNWHTQRSISSVFPTKQKLYDYLLGVSNDYPRDNYFDVECYPDYRRFCEYMNEFKPRHSDISTDQSKAVGGREGFATSEATG